MHSLAVVGMSEEILDNVKTFVYFCRVFQREEYPAVKQARTHRADCTVNYIEETFSVLVHRTHQFEISNGEAVEPHRHLLFDTGNRCDV